MDSVKKGTMITAFSATLFGTYSIFAKSAYAEGISVAEITFLRFLGATIFVYIFARLFKDDSRLEKSKIIQLLFMGAFINGGITGSINMALTLIPANLTYMLLYLYPAMVTICSVIMKNEVLTKEKAGALLLTSCGLIILLGKPSLQINTAGIMLAVLAAIFHTVYVLWGNNLLRGIKPYKAMAWIMLGGAISSLFVGVFDHSITLQHSSWVWLMIFCLTFFSSSMGHLYFWVGLKYIGPSRASMVAVLEPVVTAISTYFVFGESLTIWQICGVILILAAIIVLQRTPPKDQRVGS